MKKLSVWILTALLMLSLCACKGNQKTYQSSTATDITEKQLQELIDQAQQARGEQGG